MRPFKRIVKAVIKFVVLVTLGFNITLYSPDIPINGIELFDLTGRYEVPRGFPFAFDAKSEFPSAALPVPEFSDVIKKLTLILLDTIVWTLILYYLLSVRITDFIKRFKRKLRL